MENNLTPENENITTPEDETTSAPETEADETAEIIDDNDEMPKESGDQIGEPEPAAPVHSTNSLVRSAVTAAIVLTVFVCVYFVVTFINSQNPKPSKQAPVQSPLASAAINVAPSDSSKNTAAPAEKGNAPQAKAPDAVPGENAETAPAEKAAAPSVKYPHEEAMKLAQQAAKKQFGDDAVVFPASDAVAQEVEINGEKRMCYMFGADSMANLVKNNSMKGLYHFDANTGEIFDNQDGTMIKIEY